ncbi:hypothetical protein EKE94_03035 [Mesobaculum littorinae]|uniref:Uncharacterized protein n=1 Tax=Mesobaculum littorinae TaxID=2486419 RepID=A0A438ALW8_9RHOB|nr:hypothetical protein [Mesobaculum littorinae]RVV99672.1 hypothetical protein EKE94_03035 [Mesobaculum littorinae]
MKTLPFALLVLIGTPAVAQTGPRDVSDCEWLKDVATAAMEARQAGASYSTVTESMDARHGRNATLHAIARSAFTDYDFPDRDGGDEIIVAFSSDIMDMCMIALEKGAAQPGERE